MLPRLGKDSSNEKPYEFRFQMHPETYFRTVREFKREYQQALLNWRFKTHQHAYPEKSRMAGYNHLRKSLNAFLKELRDGRIPEEQCLLALLVVTSPKLRDDIEAAHNGQSKPSALMQYVQNVVGEVYRRDNDFKKFYDFLLSTAARDLAEERLVQLITRAEKVFLLQAFANLEDNHDRKRPIYDAIIAQYRDTHFQHSDTNSQIAEANTLIRVLIERYRTSPYSEDVAAILDKPLRYLASVGDIDIKDIYEKMGWERVLPAGYTIIGLQKDLAKPTLSVFDPLGVKPYYRVDLPSGQRLVMGVQLHAGESPTIFACDTHHSAVNFLEKFYAGFPHKWYVATNADLVIVQRAPLTASPIEEPAPAPHGSTPATVLTQDAAVPQPALRHFFPSDSSSSVGESSVALDSSGSLGAGELVLASSPPTAQLTMFQHAQSAYIKHQRAVNGAVAAVVAAATAAYTMS